MWRQRWDTPKHTWSKLTYAESIERRKKAIGTAIAYQSLVNIRNYVRSRERNETSTHARGISEMLNWSRIWYSSRSSGRGYFTPDGSALLQHRYLNLLRITWRESSRGKARRGRAWFRIRIASLIRPFILFFSHQSTPLCRFGHVSGEIALSWYSLMSDRLDWSSVREFHREFVRRERSRKWKGRVSPRIGNAARHPEGR